MTLQERIAWAIAYAGSEVKVLRGPSRGRDGYVGGYSNTTGEIIVSRKGEKVLGPTDRYTLVVPNAHNGAYARIEDLEVIKRRVTSGLPNMQIKEGLSRLDEVEKQFAEKPAKQYPVVRL